ncbi:glycosyltransferase family 4 protein [Bosea sp. ANAM02]|uniref:glycosyltransferase family 4 protein n=1 Tax=Bosea sp. ANAM02 TaxID=2020412 RepID=UPI00140ECC3E|nr:glycosyltransferase family 4 protein [Bosea sp. ANAM02]BCB18276.1 glycosyl transferase [Bosea sp. ANAM02]
MRIAFHTPLNPLGDDGVSGDRRMARQLMAALESLGHAVEPVAAPKTYFREPDPARFASVAAEADRLRDALLAGYRDDKPRPDLWFTYHNYYRSPDFLGPGIAAALGIAYVTAESSDSPRRAAGEWAAHSAVARQALADGDVHFHFTERDRQGLEPWRNAGTALLPLPPFVAPGSEPALTAAPAGTPRLITVAMMRQGAKLQSYLALARILDRCRTEDWTLSIIGDGPCHAEIAATFASLPEGRVNWCGRLDRDAILSELPRHDIFLWPGIGEAYGLVYLEAQAAGLPVVAFDSGGVAETVRAGETALLVPEHDEVALAAALTGLLRDRKRRESMGAAARRFILAERSPARAAERLAEGLALALRNRGAKLQSPSGKATP